MSKADELFNRAHDQELYAFEGETNIHLMMDDPRTRDLIYSGWEMGFSQGWERGIRALVEVAAGDEKWKRIKEALDA